MYPVLGNVNAAFSPDFDVKETSDSYVFQVDLPGIRDSDVDISITGNRLNISGKREQQQEQTNDNYYVAERCYGSFTRSFTLPQGAELDHVLADLKDGVLTITVPKQAQAQPRKIMLGAGTTKGTKPAHA
jgi:HSP20 family protein